MFSHRYSSTTSYHDRLIIGDGLEVRFFDDAGVHISRFRLWRQDCFLYNIRYQVSYSIEVSWCFEIFMVANGMLYMFPAVIENTDKFGV